MLWKIPPYMWLRRTLTLDPAKMKNRKWGISKMKDIKLKTNRKSTKSINYGMTVFKEINFIVACSINRLTHYVISRKIREFLIS